MSHIICIMKDAMNAVKNRKTILGTVCLLWLLTLSYYVVRMMTPLLQSALLDGAVGVLNNTNSNLLLIIGFIGLFISEGILALYSSKWGILFEKASNEIHIGIQSKIFDKLCKVPYSVFNSPQIYEKIELVSERYSKYCSGFLAGRTLSSLIGTFISFVFTTIVLINVDPLIAFVVVCGNFFGIFKTWLEAKLNYYSTVEKMKERRYADTYKSALFDRNMIKEIKLLGLTDYIEKKWYEYTVRVNRKTMNYNVLFLLLDLTTYLIANAFTVISLILTSRMILNGETSIGSFILVYSSSGALIDTSGSLFGAFRELSSSSYYHSLYRDLMSMPNVEPNKSEANCEKKSDVSFDILFDHVDFSYEGSENKIIDDLCLNIKQGEKIAIVGENGCGKTTLVALLNRLYVPNKGEIFISGKSQADNLSGLRRCVSTVFQDFGKYETSFRENIIMSDKSQHYSDEEVMMCVRKTGLENKIHEFESGLDTPIGRFVPGGINLSGGEWQKLAITRGLIPKDTKVLIMDEPNSALDPISEATVYKQVFDAVKEDQTLILITHRLGAIRHVDRIIVMDHGRIIEDGSHDNLMEQKGKYFEMYNAQAKWYEV